MIDKEFAQLFTNILNTSDDYCKLCLKTSSEITLVQPKYTNKLLDVIELVNLDTLARRLLEALGTSLGEWRLQECQPSTLSIYSVARYVYFKMDVIQLSRSLVCVWCEARAQAAHRVVLTLLYARDVATLLAAANDSRVYRRQLEMFLAGSNLKSGSTAALRRLATRAAARADNSTLRLCRTETLVIDSNSQGQFQHKKKNAVDGTNLGEIVISDDDSDSESIFVPLIHPKPIEQLLEKRAKITASLVPDLSDFAAETLNMAAKSPATDDTVLSDLPAKTLDMAKLPVTSNNLPPNGIQATPDILFAGQTSQFPVATVTPIAWPEPSMLPNKGSTELLYVVDKASMVLHPVYLNNQGDYSAPTLADGTNKLPIITQTMSLDPKKLKRVTEEEIQTVLKNRVEKAVKRSLGVPPDSVKKKAVESSSTDWEDKIPMDVISFMNDTEPEDSSRICAIADVRSVRT